LGKIDRASSLSGQQEKNKAGYVIQTQQKQSARIKTKMIVYLKNGSLHKKTLSWTIKYRFLDERKPFN
jgi:hypothetical protein